MGTETRTVETPEAMHALGGEIARRLQVGDVVVLTGELGAGKTTFTRGLGEQLHVRGPITSPTFVLARTHPSLVGGAPLVHVDAYRLASALELDDLDIDFANSITVVEWGRGLMEHLTDSWLDVTITRPLGQVDGLDGDDVPVEPRTVVIEEHGPRWST